MATRASLSISEPNEKWVREQIDSKEFSSRSEFVRAKLIAAEMSAERHGFADHAPQQMLQGFKDKVRKDGKL